MKKVLAINSSYRNYGYTNFLLRKIGKGFENAHINYEIINLSEKKVHQCTSCGTCHTKQSYLKCIFEEKDDVKDIFEKIITSDLVIYASPIYIFTISGLLKVLFDRFYSTMNITDFSVSKSGLMFHHISNELNSKPFIALIVCNSIENLAVKNAIDYFKIYSKFMDAKCYGVLVRNGGRITGHGKDNEKEKQYPRIFEVYKGLELVGTDIVTYGKIKNSTKKKINQEILQIPLIGLLKNLPFVKRKIISIARNKSELKESL